MRLACLALSWLESRLAAYQFYGLACLFPVCHCHTGTIPDLNYLSLCAAQTARVPNDLQSNSLWGTGTKSLPRVSITMRHSMMRSTITALLNMSHFSDSLHLTLRKHWVERWKRQDLFPSAAMSVRRQLLDVILILITNHNPHWEYPHQCSYCDKKFRRRTDRQRHERVRIPKNRRLTTNLYYA